MSFIILNVLINNTYFEKKVISNFEFFTNNVIISLVFTIFDEGVVNVERDLNHHLHFFYGARFSYFTILDHAVYNSKIIFRLSN